MSFEFQIVLTKKCNLACKYCYIKQNHAIMTTEIFNSHYKILPKLMDKYNKKNYHASLFGGEPLLNWELIKYIIPILKKDPKCTQIIIITNALLLKDDKKRQFIKDNNINLSISFDGLWNKENRPKHKGISSFEDYLKEPLKSFITSNGSCKVMVAPSSISTMTENFEWFVDKYGINNPDFSLVRDNIWTEKDVLVYKYECKRLANRVIKYYKNGINANVGLFHLYTLDLIFGKIQGKRPFGCFAGCHGAGFMPNGDIYPCARFGTNKSKIIGNSIKKKFYNKSLNYFLKPKVSNPKTFNKCLSCELYKYCNAGCTYEQIKNSYNAEPLDNVCKLLKITYKETIRITNELKNNKLYKTKLKSLIKNVG